MRRTGEGEDGAVGYYSLMLDAGGGWEVSLGVLWSLRGGVMLCHGLCFVGITKAGRQDGETDIVERSRLVFATQFNYDNKRLRERELVPLKKQTFSFPKHHP